MIYDSDTSPNTIQDHLAHWQRQAAYYARSVAALTGMERPGWEACMRASLADARHRAAELALLAGVIA